MVVATNRPFSPCKCRHACCRRRRRCRCCSRHCHCRHHHRCCCCCWRRLSSNSRLTLTGRRVSWLSTSVSCATHSLDRARSMCMSANACVTVTSTPNSFGLHRHRHTYDLHTFIERTSFFYRIFFPIRTLWNQQQTSWAWCQYDFGHRGSYLCIRNHCSAHSLDTELSSTTSLPSSSSTSLVITVCGLYFEIVSVLFFLNFVSTNNRSKNDVFLEVNTKILRFFERKKELIKSCDVFCCVLFYVSIVKKKEIELFYYQRFYFHGK